MAHNALKIMFEVINSSYGAYMSAFGVMFACLNYDTYRMNEISHELATKYNPTGATYINVKNTFMCPVGRCNIYSINKGTNTHEFIASEMKFIVPPVVKLWDDEFIINGKYVEKNNKN
jgi:hypothetical protein